MMKFSIYLLLPCALFLPLFYGSSMVTNELPQKKTLLWTVDWSPNDQLIAVGGDDSLLKIYDSQKLKVLQTYPIKSMIRQLSWHPKKNILAIATNDDELSILDTETKKIVKLNGIKNGARGIGWNYDGTLLATADNDGLVKIWDLSGKLLRLIKKEDSNSYFSLHWHPSKNILAVSGDDIRIIDTAGTTLKVIKHRKEQTGILAVRWNPSGDFFATGDYGHDKDGIKSIIQFWKTDGSLIKTLYGSRAEYRNIQWNKNGDYLASGSDALRIWSKKGELLYTGKSAHLFWGIDWNSKSDRIITTSLNGKIQLWTAQAKLIKEAVE